jgi:hypothetical protein
MVVGCSLLIMSPTLSLLHGILLCVILLRDASMQVRLILQVAQVFLTAGAAEQASLS